MSWKSELDRTLHEVLRRALDDPRGDTSRALSLVNDFVALNPSRAESHFALGVVEESLLGRPPAPQAAAPAPDADGVAPSNGETAPVALASSDGEGSLWRWLGRLDTAARSGTAERVRALAADSSMDAAVERAREGRIALRAAARALLVGGEDARAFDLYRRHLAAAPDEGSRKDADALVGDAVRRADDLLTDPDPGATSAALGRALAFAEAVGLEGRVGAKIERKLGRAHQLSGRWADAATCYRAALARLPADDRYRAVLQGDLALAALEVRGTLDLLPTVGRAGVADAEKMLTEAQGAGDGESYNAIYTLGVLAYEREDWATAATRFREADRLMKETRAKARIVHARARFFLGACLLRQGVTGEALAEAEDLVLRDANAASLDPSLKDPVLQALAAVSPGARIQGREAAPRSADGEPVPARSDGRDGRDGRGGRRERGGDRGDRGGDRGGRGGRGARPAPQDRMARYAADGPRPQGDRSRGAEAPRDGGPAAPAPSTDAASFLALARRSLDTDPHQALKAVDDAFKSRPTFEEWYAAYRVRLEALIRLGERGEALRTYERFRAKLHERGRADRLEELLLDASGPMAEVLEEVSHRAELVDLYESMPGRERAFVEASVAHAAHHAQAGTPLDLRKAVSLLREAIARGGDEAQAMWEDVAGRARAAGVPVDGPTPEEMKDRLSQRAARIVLVGGDESSRGHGDRVKDIGRRAGFEGALVLGGARPHHRTLADVEEQARQGAAAIVLLHTTPQDVRDAVKKLGADLSVPVREIPYAGAASLETELLTEVGLTL